MFEIPQMDEKDLVESLSNGEPTTAEFIKANLKDGFMNSPLGVTYNSVMETFQGAPDQRASDVQASENLKAFYEKREPKVVDPNSPQLRKGLSAEDYARSEYFRPGVKWQDGHSEERAKYIAEVHDDNQSNNFVMEKGNPEPWYERPDKAGLGFISQMIGGAGDPINAIPFGAGVKLGGKLTTKIVAGAVEGGLGNLGTALITRPYWEDRGVESHWHDYLQDLAMGGVLGGGLSGVGHAFSKDANANLNLKDKNALGKAIEASVQALQKGEEPNLKSIKGFDQAVTNLYDIPEVKRSQKVEELTSQLEGMGFSKEDARTSIAPMVAHAQAFAKDFNMDMDQFLNKYGADFQKSGALGDFNQSAFHGTRYEFDEFTTKRIGAGEGAQAFGWGLYFAEDKSIAEHYRKTLSSSGRNSVPVPPDIKKIIKDNDNFGFDRVGDAIAAFRESNDWVANWDAADLNPEDIVKINDYLALGTPKVKDGGQLYKVKIPEKTEMLDWDRPYKEQPENVKKAMLQLFEAGEVESYRTGDDLYAALSHLLGGDRNASLALQKAGVPGLKYLDNSSRAKGEGKQNFVVFDDSHVKIEETFYQSERRKSREEDGFILKDNEVIQNDVKVPDELFITNAKPLPKTKGLELDTAKTQELMKKRLAGMLNEKDIINLSTEQTLRIDDRALSSMVDHAIKIHGQVSQKSKGGADKIFETYMAALNDFKEVVHNAVYLAKDGDKKIFFTPIKNGKQEAVGKLIVGKDGRIEGFEMVMGNSTGEVSMVADTLSGRRADAPTPVMVSISDFKKGLKNAREKYSFFQDSATSAKASPEGVPTKRGTERGSITFHEDGKAIISLFEGADKSTILHESGHLFLNNLEKFSKLQDAPASIRADYDKIRGWLGVKEGEAIHVKHHEKFARGFEQYLREGKAPRPELQSVFGRFKDWLKSIYKSAEQLDVKLSDNAREVYSKLLGGDGKRTFEAPSKMEAPSPIFKSEEEIDAAVSQVEAHLNNGGTVNSVDAGELESLRSVLESSQNEEKALDQVMTFFQSAKTAEDLEKAAKDAGMSKKDFKRLVEEFNKELGDASGLLEVSRVIDQKKAVIAHEVKMAKRQAYLSAVAKEKVSVQARKLIENGATPLQAVLSQIEGESSLRGVKGAGNSVFGTYQALSQATNSKMHGELKAISPQIEKLFEGDRNFNENVITEMMQIRQDGKGQVGVTGDDLAVKSAAVLAKYAEESRQRINLSGGDIGKLDGWVPRTHDVEKMILKGESAWSTYMKENLDLDKTFNGLEGKELDRALYETYQNLITDVRKGKKVDIENPIAKTPRNIAKSLGESRVLHFKDVAGELTYLKEYGQGTNILETMTRHLDGMSRKTALMERLGPNPDSVIASTIEDLRQDIRDKKIYTDASDEERIKLLDKLGDKQSIINREKAIGKSMMFMLGEANSLENLQFKNVAQTIRTINSVSKLGAATLSQFPDFLNLVNENRLVRGNNFASAWVDVMKHYFSDITPEKQKVLNRIGVMADSINFANYNKFDADNLNNKLGRMNDVLFKITGQDWHTRKAKSGFALMLSKDLGDYHGKAFSELPEGLREALTQYGSFTSEKWDLLKELDAETVDGEKYFHPDLIENLDDEKLEAFIPEEFKTENKPFKDEISEAESVGLEIEPGEKLKGWEADRADALKRAKLSLANDLRTFFIEETRNAVLEPDLKIKRQVTFGTKSGTVSGEAIRMMTQFKSFAYAYYDRSLRGKRFSKTGDMSDYGGVVHQAAASLFLGYMSMTAKDLSKNLEPKDPTLPQTWLQAGFQSGGLGIMGDFLQAGLARTGADALATIAGPTATTAANTLNLAGKVSKGVYKEMSGDDGDFEGLLSDAIDLGRAQVPFQSLWYARAAADYLIWRNIKETLEPGSVARSERRLRREFNQKSLID